jgi:hypothetical protein
MHGFPRLPRTEKRRGKLRTVRFEQGDLLSGMFGECSRPAGDARAKRRLIDGCGSAPRNGVAARSDAREATQQPRGLR